MANTSGLSGESPRESRLNHEAESASFENSRFSGSFRASAQNENDFPSLSSEDLSKASEEFLSGVQSSEQERYSRFTQEMKFPEFMQEVFKKPEQYIRNAPQYTVDAFDAYGSTERVILGQKILDFNIKNWPWQSKAVSRPTVLVGQEIPLHNFYQANRLFARESHPTRMIVFHGRPGGGKTLLAETIDAALEDYSRNHPDGGLYRLILVFDGKDKEKIGFDRHQISKEEKSDTEKESTDRYVFRPEGNTDPIFLISKDIPVTVDGQASSKSAREELFDRLVSMGRLSPDFQCRDYLLRGELDSATERLMEELLIAYDGDLAKVIENHVRVERWHYSSKTGRGLASVKPNHDWASDIEPLYHQQMLQYAVPPEQLQGAERDLYIARAIALSTNRGHLHYADLLRPNERDRGEQDIARLSYLLEMIENGEVQIAARGRPALLRTESINTVIRADSNDTHILAKSQGSAWEAFRQRCNFITVGLTTRYLEEARAHKEYLSTLLGDEGGLSPHALNTFALFVTATRLLRPTPEFYAQGQELPKLVGKLSVVEKALLLQEPKEGENVDMNVLRTGADRYTTSQLRLFKRHVNTIAREYQIGVGETNFSFYEGGLGISTRAAQDLLRDIVRNAETSNITALDVLGYLSKRVESGSLEYYQEVGEYKEQQRKALEQKYLESKDIEELSQQELEANRERAAAVIEKRFPVPDPKLLLQDVVTFARQRMLEDIYRAIGIVDTDSRALSLRKYIEHVSAQRTGDPVPEKYRTLHGDDAHRADEALMQDFEDRVQPGKLSGSDTKRQVFRRKLLMDLGSWATENPSEEIEGNLENIFPNLMAGIRRVQEQSLNNSLRQFVEDTRRYVEKPELVEEDLAGDITSRERVREWQKVEERLMDSGYSKETIAKHVLWATKYIDFGSSEEVAE